MTQTAMRADRSTCKLDAPLNDQVIRNGLLEKRLRGHVRSASTLVIHELGLAHARRRIDLAVINGVIQGFEIKSAVDNLARLGDQLETYSQSLQKLTMVVTDRHVAHVMESVPTWCGVTRAHRGRRGGLGFETLQRAKRNPKVDRFVLAHLLWRDEAQSILAQLGASKAELRAPRAVLYKTLVEMLSETQLAAHIKAAMTQRQVWRDRLRPSLCGG